MRYIANIRSINFSNPEELSILQIANLIRILSIKKVNFNFSKEFNDDPFRRKPSLDLP